jgi:serpin B
MRTLNNFAFKFFHHTLQRDTKEDNQLISPLSAYLALSLVCNGAAGRTKDEMIRVLQLSGISVDELNTMNKALLKWFPAADKKVQLSIANSIWFNKDLPGPLKAFLDINKEYYNSHIQPLDFSDVKAAGTINAWVDKQTSHKISSILTQTSGHDLVYLVNAIYFNAAWSDEFDPNITSDSLFRPADGNEVRVPFMSRTGSFRLLEEEDFTLVELPYGDSQAYVMYLVLPAAGQPIGQLAPAFGLQRLEGAFPRLYNKRVRLFLPRWEYAYSIEDMLPLLAELGMNNIPGTADFSGMYPPDLPVHLTKTIHKTYIKVGEKGTEAAAVTGMAMRSITANIEPPPTIRFDRPFLYLISDNKTGTILFMGKVGDPSKK